MAQPDPSEVLRKVAAVAEFLVEHDLDRIVLQTLDRLVPLCLYIEVIQKPILLYFLYPHVFQWLDLLSSKAPILIFRP